MFLGFIFSFLPTVILRDVQQKFAKKIMKKSIPVQAVRSSKHFELHFTLNHCIALCYKLALPQTIFCPHTSGFRIKQLQASTLYHIARRFFLYTPPLTDYTAQVPMRLIWES